MMEGRVVKMLVKLYLDSREQGCQHPGGDSLKNKDKYQKYVLIIKRMNSTRDRNNVLASFGIISLLRYSLFFPFYNYCSSNYCNIRKISILIGYQKLFRNKGGTKNCFAFCGGTNNIFAYYNQMYKNKDKGCP